jgi:hypothetical protein
MSYLTEIETNRAQVTSYVILNLRWADDDTGWTAYSGSPYANVYYKPWPYGDRIENLTLAPNRDSIDGSTYKHFVDEENKLLYFNFTGGPVGLTAFYSGLATFTVKMFLSNTAKYWYRTPTDTASGTVYYKPYLIKLPIVNQSIEDVQNGFFSITSSGLNINNADQWFNQFMNEYVSFNNGAIEIYHQVGSDDVSNIRKIFRGKLGDVTWTQKSISIKTFFEVQELEKTIFTDDDIYAKYYTGNSDIAPTIGVVDPAKDGIWIPQVYGFSRNIPATNVNFQDVSTSTNRKWGVCLGSSLKDGTSGTGVWKLATVPASPTSTTTRTYVDDATGFIIGDTVWLDKAADEWRIVTDVQYTGNNYIEHAALGAGAASTGDTVKTGRVSRITVIHQGTPYLCYFNRDYTTPDTLTGIPHTMIQFVNNFEANVGMSTPLEPSDTVIAEHVYGTTNRPTNGGAFGTISTTYGTNTDHVSLVYLFLDQAGITEINGASFTALEAEQVLELGFKIPYDTNGTMPTYRELLEKIFQSTLTRIYLDEDLKWSIARVKPTTFNSSTDKELTQYVNRNDSIQFETTFKDAYKYLRLKYKYSERGILDSRAAWKIINTSDSTPVEVINFQTLHQLSKEKEVETFLLSDGEAQEIFNRMEILFCMRRGILTVTAPIEAFSEVLNNTVRISAEKLPGFVYEAGTTRNIDGIIVGIDKGKNEVTLTTDDIKPVNIFSSDF